MREKLAHTERDVLAESARLKGIFCHVARSPTQMRFEQEYAALLSAAEGLRILDVGCGRGEQSIALLKAGATVTGIDISERYIEEAREHALHLGIKPQRFVFSTMDAHDLDFPDSTFDMVVGRGILHHLDLELCLQEIKRVLKVGGRAVFHEPLAANPLLKVFRWLTPGARTVDEHPLTRVDLQRLEQNWQVESSYYGILSAPAAMATSVFLRPFPGNWLLKATDFAERRLNRIRWVNAYNQYVLLNLVRTD